MNPIIQTSTFPEYINPTQDIGGGTEKPPTSFYPVTSPNVGVTPQNFLTYNFHPSETLLQNFKVIPSTSPKLLNRNQDDL